MVCNDWKDFLSGNMISYILIGLFLRNGVKYIMRVGVINYVGFLVLFEINGIVIDIILLVVNFKFWKLINFFLYIYFVLN